ncbi:hypothetical protein VY88_00530 [Azospirillum thiophilum]|uniref:Antitoxin n=1 Tax=Azospirillum thiophilum TaxID=528244 RepID=A0AAC8VY04_9PROT|nr:type II toxin-antitoxin system Phd/YefM family antitoxin [Azospirillum thiophilum]ALG71548.1 hypothetical protein AL072_12180 [Azospirillum thiophilum]KJR64805.1 hypothetical protein VY88_00530 [Azospirillum thiophilum]
MSLPVVTVSVTEFKAKCLSLFDDLEDRRVGKIVVTRHGRPVAELNPPDRTLPPLFGAHPGSAAVVGDYDLTRPTSEDEIFDAEGGILHR